MAASQVCIGPYPQTVEQMNAWGKQVSRYSMCDVARALNLLDGIITIRRAD